MKKTLILLFALSICGGAQAQVQAQAQAQVQAQAQATKNAGPESVAQSAQGQAGQAPSGKSISLDLNKALEIALNDNPTIRIAGLEIQRMEYVRKETTGNLIPNLSGTGSYSYNIMQPVMFLPDGAFGPGMPGGAMRMGFANSFSGGLSLGIPLYMPMIYRTMQMNQQQMLSAVESARSSKIELANQVKKSYFGILLGQKSVQVIRDNIGFAQLVVNDAQNAFNQGVVSEYDLITAQVQLSNLHPTLLSAENSVRNTKLMLKMLLSLPTDVSVELEQTLLDYSAEASSENEVMGMEVDLQDNSDLKLLELQKNIVGKQLHIQKAARIPTISAMAQYQVLSQSNNFNIGQYVWKGTALAGLQLSIPMFSGLTNINKERQIKNSIEQLDVQREYLQESLSVEAQTAQSNMLRATEQTISCQASLSQAEKGYRIARTRYDTGAGTIVDLNSAQMAQLQANLNYSQAIFDYMSAKADLDKVLGRIN